MNRDDLDIEELNTEILCADDSLFPAEILTAYDNNVADLRSWARGELGIEKILLYFVCQHAREFRQGSSLRKPKPPLFHRSWVQIALILQRRLGKTGSSSSSSNAEEIKLTTAAPGTPKHRQNMFDMLDMKRDGTASLNSSTASLGGGESSSLQELAAGSDPLGAGDHDNTEGAMLDLECLGPLYLSFESYMFSLVKLFLPAYEAGIQKVVMAGRRYTSSRIFFFVKTPPHHERDFNIPDENFCTE